MNAKRTASMWVAAGLSLGCALGIGGCPIRPGDGPGDELSDGDKAAVAAAAKSSASLAQAINTAKNTAETGENQSACHVPVPTTSQELTFGSCPVVTLAAADGMEAISVTLDFGESGCNPGSAEDFACAGSATGTYDQQAGLLAVSFEQIACNDTSLDGDIDVQFDIEGYTVQLDGDWSLSYQDGDDTITTDGSGQGTYDATTKVTTIPAFAGTLSDGTSSWSAVLSNVEISYETYGNLIPYAGEATITGDGQTLTIRFDTASPTTGIVEVSTGGLTFEVNLFEL